MSNDIAGVLFSHQNRIKEIADVLARYGFARLPITPQPLPTLDFAPPSLPESRIQILRP